MDAMQDILMFLNNTTVTRPRKNGFKKDLPQLPPREFFRVYIINK